jgi:hypothetical protein
MYIMQKEETRTTSDPVARALGAGSKTIRIPEEHEIGATGGVGEFQDSRKANSVRAHERNGLERKGGVSTIRRYGLRLTVESLHPEHL